MANLVRTQVLFSEPMLEDLRLLAVERGWSVSRVVRNLVSDKVEKRKKKAAGQVMELMVRKAYKGRVPQDLSINDEYLYGRADR